MGKITKFLVMAVILVAILSFSGCKQDTTLPSLSTVQVLGVTQDNAQCIVDIHGDGGSDVLQVGVCWGTTQNPVVPGGSVYVATNIVSSFTGFLTNLQPATTYYVRGFALNEVGYAYGNELTFTTLP